MPRAVLTYPEAFPRARLRPLSGATEYAIAAAAAAPGTRPERVTAVLAAAYATIGEAAASLDLVRRLCAAAREWMLQRVALLLRPDLDWFEAPCAACGAVYDVGLRMGSAPRKPAGPGFPVASVATRLGPRGFEAPCGWHEERGARRGAGGDPRRVFAALTGLAEAAEDEAARFGPDDLERIDAALEAMSPDVADRAQAACPACGAATEARIEPLRFTMPSPAAILGEAHLLAGAYHWPEEAILALPPDRRVAYAELIRRDRGAAR